MRMINGNWTEWGAICIGKCMIASTIWDKSVQVNLSKANQIAQAHSAGAICSPGKINECWFIPNGTKKIMWLLVINSNEMSLFHVMAHQFGHLPLPFCQSSWAFSSRIQALKTSLVNHWAFVFFLCWVSVNCRNYHMIAIELIMFPIFCMNCCTKLLKNFILYIVTLNKP